MKRTPTMKQWVALALGALLLTAVLALRARSDLAQLGQDAELIRLREERRRLESYGDAVVQAARMTVENLRQPRTDVAPSDWTVEWVPAVSPRTSLQRLRRTAPVGWTDIVRTVEGNLARTGTRCLSLDISSRGSRQVRAIAAVEMVLEHPAETPSRRNPSDGTVFPGAIVPATPPAVGAGPSLRRPAASAEPPASGQASAPVRPDPRGSRAGFPSTQQLQPKQP